ncbi:DUF2752 domain-containing protein [Phycicoccus sp. HDW14]|uniref:DUF2752 domain-containing protein n=1 Tax=Phycicoccus sp. HDW14 TaxID=2714941 RepID=UPI00140DD0D3|nr:DUF2752 domain-containing protein [Phycicoccus sp. HDW14]QIM21951.1 DUF2752 domain-containing protein [Phycicoccus sp. HDW14]
MTTAAATALQRVRSLGTSTTRWHRVLPPAGVAAATAAVVSLLGAVDPNVPGHFPPCPWLFLTGTYCPGCGTLRAIHALAHGDVGTALARNPFAVVATGWLAVWFVVWSRRLWQGRQRTRMAPAWVLYTLFGAILGYWVLRNVPGWTWLSPA